MIEDKLSIKGEVLCSCGGPVITNSGKVVMNYEERKLYCWWCNRPYDLKYAYSMRKENEIVKLPLPPIT